MTLTEKVLEALDKEFGENDRNESLAEKIVDSYNFAMEHYRSYGYIESTRAQFVWNLILGDLNASYHNNRYEQCINIFDCVVLHA